MSLDRLRDANALRDRDRIVGAVYMLGYSVECMLKALIRLRRPVPPKIHHLGQLWRDAGFKYGDAPKRWRGFLTDRIVLLRYSCVFEPGADGRWMYDNGMELLQYIRRITWRSRRR